MPELQLIGNTGHVVACHFPLLPGETLEQRSNCVAPAPSDGAVSSATPILIHSSWRGIVAGHVSTIVLTLFSAVAFTGGAVVIGWLFGVVALVVALIVFLDYPIATAFGPSERNVAACCGGTPSRGAGSRA